MRLGCLPPLALSLALATVGCSSTASIIKAMADSKRTICTTITSIYGTVKIAGTGIENGSVQCNDGQMSTKSTPPVEPAPVQVGVPIVVTPQLSIGQPTTTNAPTMRPLR